MIFAKCDVYLSYMLRYVTLLFLYIIKKNQVIDLTNIFRTGLVVELVRPSIRLFDRFDQFD